MAGIRNLARKGVGVYSLVVLPKKSGLANILHEYFESNNLMNNDYKPI